MSKITAGFKVRLEYVLDQVCIGASDGGSHEMRRFVAERLMTAAQAEERSLEGLTEVARQALDAFSGQFAAKSRHASSRVAGCRGQQIVSRVSVGVIDPYRQHRD
jgi:dihydroxyacetone kinase